ncbi:hypothetical protein BDV93DRAFT_268755 [Ceratobasidium sp. AG-I]|nr:hypothetical protein BDV93DRAFT_268755 [Ceratobasidium sp. AG-I]
MPFRPFLPLSIQYSSHQDAPEVPTHPEVHPEAVPQVEFEGQSDIQVQANADPQDDPAEMVGIQGEAPFNPIPPAFEGGPVLNATQAPLMRSLHGFEGILQTED